MDCCSRAPAGPPSCCGSGGAGASGAVSCYRTVCSAPRHAPGRGSCARSPPAARPIRSRRGSCTARPGSSRSRRDPQARQPAHAAPQLRNSPLGAARRHPRNIILGGHALTRRCTSERPARTPHAGAKPENPIAHRPWPAAPCFGGYRTPAGARFPSKKSAFTAVGGFPETGRWFSSCQATGTEPQGNNFAHFLT